MNFLKCTWWLLPWICESNEVGLAPRKRHSEAASNILKFFDRPCSISIGYRAFVCCEIVEIRSDLFLALTKQKWFRFMWIASWPMKPICPVH